jgi:hypothetical protein
MIVMSHAVMHLLIVTKTIFKTMLFLKMVSYFKSILILFLAKSILILTLWKSKIVYATLNKYKLHYI